MSTDPDDLHAGTLAAMEAAAGVDGMFADLDDQARAVIEAEAEWTLLGSGDTLFREGDAGDALYVLVSGRLRVLVASPAGENALVAEIGRGESVGEMALLTGAPRSATVIAVRDSRLVRLSQAGFERIVQRCPQAMLLVTRRLVQRLQQTTHAPRMKASMVTIAVVPLDGSIDAAAVAGTLVAALSLTGRATLVTRAHAEAQLGGRVGGGRDARLTAWLDALERDFQHVVYAGDAQSPDWTDRTARQADCLLFVAPGQSEPGPGVVEIVRRSAHVPAARELLLLHPAPYAPPRYTARWLDATGARVHYHVRAGLDPDITRLARMLTGRGVGLVLGGGGARGFAHLGVIQALHDAGVPIDAIGGTSMGAVLAAQYAGGCDAAAMRVLNREHWIRRNPLKDKTLPVVALLAGRRLDRMITGMFGDTQIEDLWTTFFCVSADLTRAEMRVHARGALGQAARASMSLPGVAIPVHDAGSMLVDGGLMNNVPADIMRGLCGRVVAVDVSPAKDLVITAPYASAASGWRLLWGRKATNLPGIGAILMRAVMLGSTRHQALIARDVDLFLHPPVERFGMFEWASMDRIADTGYACARDALVSGRAALT
jgi:predicted acylesterase/phospholipase RssA/CRP-like cAMP-binding protein